MKQILALLLFTATVFGQFDPTNPKIQGVTVLTKTNPVAVGNQTLTGNLLANGATLTNALTVANGGTGTGTAFTAGSVVFAGTSGVYAQDNSNFFFDDTNNRVGIGNSTPASRLDLEALTEQFRLRYDITHYASFTVNSSGNLTVNPTGGIFALGPQSPVGAGLFISAAATPQFTLWDQSLAANQHAWACRINGSVGTGIFQIYSAVDAGSAANTGINIDRTGAVAVGRGSTTNSGGKLEIVSTTEQLRTSYDSSNYASYTVSSGGDLTIAPSGGDTTITGTLTVSKVLATTPSALTYASPTSVDVTLGNVFTVTTVNATGSVTFNATAGGTAGQRIVFIVTNDATSAKTITFGTNFVPNGTLTPSGVNKVATIEFISNGTSFYELARTVLP